MINPSRFNKSMDVTGAYEEKLREQTRKAILDSHGCLVGASEILDLTIGGITARVGKFRLNKYVVADTYVQQRPYKPALLPHESAVSLYEYGLE